MESDYRLTPTMRSRKLQVVSFVKQYIARWGQWPSYGEIGEAMGIKPPTARDAVKRAVRDGLLHREPGSRKGVPVGPRSRMSSAEASVLLEQLRDAGVVVIDTSLGPDAHTFCTLPVSPPFRHIPDIE